MKLFALLLLVFLTGCEAMPWEEGFFRELSHGWRAVVAALNGEPRPGASGKPRPTPSPSESETAQVKQARANANLLREIYDVALMEEPKNRSSFGNYVDTMNQGASIEGLYNGFTHSGEYRKREIGDRAATPTALGYFAVQLAALEVEMSEPAHFDARSARPLAKPQYPGEEGAAPPKGDEREDSHFVDFAGKPVAKPSVTPSAQLGAALTSDYTNAFVGAPIFTLKRVLGDEALRLMSEKQKIPGQLYRWYGKWAAEAAAWKVDFGDPFRNQADEKVHYEWAKTMSEDRVKWEVLTRLHRLLNQGNQTTY